MTSNTIYHYVYRITNIVENKHYYGKRSSKIEPKLDLGKKYFSSSTDKEFITDQKLNSQNYKYKIVQTFNTEKEALAREIELHSKFDVKLNEKFYNRCNATHLGFSMYGTKASIETGIKISKRLKGRRQTEEHIRNRALANNDFNTTKGRKVSAETKAKISKSTKGIPKSEAAKQALIGRPVSEETRLKISKSNKKPKALEHRENMSKAFKKYHYITPIGTVDDTRHLEPIITTNQIRAWCIHPDNIISNLSYTKSKYLYTNYLREQIVGMSYRDLGFDRIKKS